MHFYSLTINEQVAYSPGIKHSNTMSLSLTRGQRTTIITRCCMYSDSVTKKTQTP